MESENKKQLYVDDHRRNIQSADYVIEKTSCLVSQASFDIF